MERVQALLDAAVAGLTIGVPLLIAAGVAWGIQWLRLRRAQLRAQRMELPPSSEPPEPSDPWYSLRPLATRLQSARRRRRRRTIRLPPR